MKPFGVRVKEHIPKVVGIPTREPINKQSALVVRPAPYWAKPLSIPSTQQQEMESLRNENAKMKSDLLVKSQQLASLSKHCQKLKVQCGDLSKQLSELIAFHESQLDKLTGDERSEKERVIRRAKLFSRIAG